VAKKLAAGFWLSHRRGWLVLVEAGTAVLLLAVGEQVGIKGIRVRRVNPVDGICGINTTPF